MFVVLIAALAPSFIYSLLPYVPSYSWSLSDNKLIGKPTQFHHLLKQKNLQHSLPKLPSFKLSSNALSPSSQSPQSLDSNTIKQNLLNYINLVSSKAKCSKSNMKEGQEYISLDSKDIPSFIVRNKFNMTYTSVNMLSSIFSNYNPLEDNFHFMRSAFQSFVNIDLNIHKARVVWLDKKVINSEKTFTPNYYFSILQSKSTFVAHLNHTISLQEPWIKLIGDNLNIFELLKKGSMPVLNFLSKKCESIFDWSNAYFSCEDNAWLFSYTSLIILPSAHQCVIKGLISIDININQMDINQCDTLINRQWTIPLLGTHKCHRISSQVI